jgi:hypothetical protein
MADDQTLRSYRPNDPYRRGQPEVNDPNVAGDPLAELARLIGQNDPFADHARNQRSGHNPREAAHAAAPEGDWRRSVQPPVYDQDQDYRQDPAPRHHAYEMTAEREAAFHDPYRTPAVHAEDYQDQRYAAEPGYHSPREAYGRDDADMHHAHGFDRYGDDAYDDPPQQRRGGALVTAVILIGCAMLGTAGAYGYRTYYADTGTKRAPVIVADRSPSKIVPPATQSKSGKAQEQTGPTGSTEQLVSREEQPMAIRPPGTTAAPRVVLPAPVASNGAASASPPAATSGESEPKRIRTVTIRPEQADPSGRPAGGFPDVAPPSPPSPPPAAAAPPPRAPARSTARVTAAPPAASRDYGAPLSLQPGAPGPRADAAPPPAQRTITPPAPRAGAAPRVAAVPSSRNGASGGYLVQVSSQRSEADARASFRALQGKYPQVLNGRQAVVRRADLGSRGVYYRAMVGPFDSAAEANQLCRNLKAAGGQCIIQRN